MFLYKLYFVFTIQEKLEKTQAILADKYSKKLLIDRFLETIKFQDDLITGFSPKLFTSIADNVEVFLIREVNVYFKNSQIVGVDVYQFCNCKLQSVKLKSEHF